MPHAIRIHKHGGPEVMVWEEVALAKPGPGEALIRQTAIGLNFVDVYNRSGLYPAQLPAGLGAGLEPAARVAAEVHGGLTRQVHKRTVGTDDLVGARGPGLPAGGRRVRGHRGRARRPTCRSPSG